MTAPRRGLGRGLGALIPETAGPAVQEVDIDLIVPNPHQPRSVFNAEALSQLADSIKEHGVIQPLVVTRPAGGAVYQLIAGERRLLASRQAGLKRVPVIVKEANPRALLELALVENLQREDLGPLEEAAAFKRLIDEFELTQDAVAARVGRSRSAVANTLRLLSLPDEIQASLAQGKITAGHARALLGIDDKGEQRRVWQRILQAQLNVREAEQLAQGSRKPASRRVVRAKASPDLAAVQDKLRSALGTKVDVVKARKGGRLTIHFYSDEEFDSLLDRLLSI